MSVYDRHLNKNTARFVALSPMNFVERGAEVFEDRFFLRDFLVFGEDVQCATPE